jgi:dipeptidyl aminopeptidase/acylaminoacyl peptidase
MKMRSFGLVLVWAGLVAALGNSVGQTAQKRAMTFADLMAMKRVSDPQISPSGKWVMFSVTDVSLEKNTKVNHLWVVALGGSAPEQQVTSNTGESFGRFSPDGKFVSYTGSPTKDDPVSRITIATWDEATGTIGVGRTLKAVSGDADGAIWSPDSKHFLFTTDVYPECSDKATWAEEDACDAAKDTAADKSPVKGQVWDALLYRHWDHYVGAKRSHILEADFSLDGANPRDLTPRSAVGDVEVPTYFVGGAQDYVWAPDSKEIAYVAKLDPVPAASTNNDVFTLRLDEPGAKAVKVSTSPGSDDEPEYSPDGKWLAFRSQARGGFESDKFRLMVMDRETKAIKDLMPKFDNWVDEFIWAPDSKELYFASGMSGAANIFRYSLVDKTLTIQTRGVRGFEMSEDSSMFRSEPDLGEYSDIHVSSDGNFLVAGMVSMRAPTEIVSLKVEDREEGNDTGQRVARRVSDGSESTIRNVLLVESRITHLNDRTFTVLDVPKVEPFWFTGAEGTKVEGFILRPPGFDPAKKYPVKFLMHGGPQTAWGDAWSYRWNWEGMWWWGSTGAGRRGMGRSSWMR